MDKDYYDDIEWYYENRKTQGIGVVIECFSCQYEIECEVFRNGYPPQYAWLCEICAGSYAGNSYWYPQQYDGSIMQHIAWCTNHIIKVIEKTERILR